MSHGPCKEHISTWISVLFFTSFCISFHRKGSVIPTQLHLYRFGCKSEIMEFPSVPLKSLHRGENTENHFSPTRSKRIWVNRCWHSRFTVEGLRRWLLQSLGPICTCGIKFQDRVSSHTEPPNLQILPPITKTTFKVNLNVWRTCTEGTCRVQSRLLEGNYFVWLWVNKGLTELIKSSKEGLMVYVGSIRRGKLCIPSAGFDQFEMPGVYN